MYKKLGRHTIVLLGVGHTNAHVLRMWKMNPIRNAQLVCVSDYPISTYSGMLPAVLAGQRPVPAMEIDLVRLCHSAGARLIIGTVNGLDLEAKRLLFADRPALSYDVLSIGIGSRPTFGDVVVEDGGNLLPVKPMQTLLTRLTSRMEELRRLDRPPKIAIVGGGAGSIEVACCLRQWLANDPDMGVGQHSPEITLVTGSDVVGGGLLDSTRNRIEKHFAANQIQTLVGSRVAKIEGPRLSFKDGTEHEFDMVVWATSAVASPLFEGFDLERDSRGFLLTRPTLQTKSNDDVFVVGDSGTMETDPTPKAGVYAVRQGPILWDNIRRRLDQRTLTRYVPQKGFLKLLNFGDGTAIAEYRGFSFEGGWCWRLKDRIDVKFMEMYQDYSLMKMKPADDLDDSEMRCLGCGGKIGSQILSQVLAELEIPPHEDVIVGLQHPDDAAVVRTYDNQVTVTTDFFAAPFEDPYLVGRIATLNSASDCFVMGAQPSTALAIVQLPLGHPRAQLQVMRELMAGSFEELKKMGATIVGGHTIEGPRMTIGYTILGRQVSDIKTKGALEVGDRLVLSKPLGAGVLLVGLMQSLLSGHHYRELLDSMLQSNQIALELIRQFPVSAITDVTGFGFAGHLAEMLLASNVSAEIDVDSIPLLSGCRDLIERGIESTLAPDNRSVAAKIEIDSKLPIDSKALGALFDPQTGGGLLFGIADKRADEAIEFLRRHGLAHSVSVGQVVAAGAARMALG